MFRGLFGGGGGNDNKNKNKQPDAMQVDETDHQRLSKLFVKWEDVDKYPDMKLIRQAEKFTVTSSNKKRGIDKPVEIHPHDLIFCIHPKEVSQLSSGVLIHPGA